jgi:CBS domain containing-hemolysin-like protein
MNLLLAFFGCLAAAAFFSAAEMAFVSANKIRMREKADSGDRAAKKIMRLQEQPQAFLTAVLVSSNVVGITATAIVTYALHAWYRLESEWLTALIVVPVFIIFGETLPKDFGRLRSQAFLLRFAPILDLLAQIFRFPSAIILKGISFFLSPFGSMMDRSIFVSESEFRMIIEEGSKTGMLEAHEKKIMETILDFERIHVESVMLPVEKMPTVDIHEKVGKVKQIARETHSRMVLVYEEIPSIVVGMIYVFDVLFEADDDASLKNFLRSPIFMTKTTSIEKAFYTLQERRQSFAVVTDIYGEVIGVVPIERLFTL